jgi:hypothetical protein
MPKRIWKQKLLNTYKKIKWNRFNKFKNGIRMCIKLSINQWDEKRIRKFNN